MSKPYYVYRIDSRLPYAIQMNIGAVKNCDCYHLPQRGKYHRKVCASRSNYNLVHKLTPTQRLKSKFLPAEKIFNFYTPKVEVELSDEASN